jgi:hypothetical protein
MPTPPDHVHTLHASELFGWERIPAFRSATILRVTGLARRWAHDHDIDESIVCAIAAPDGSELYRWRLEYTTCERHDTPWICCRCLVERDQHEWRQSLAVAS